MGKPLFELCPADKLLLSRPATDHSSLAFVYHSRLLIVSSVMPHFSCPQNAGPENTTELVYNGYSLKNKKWMSFPRAHAWRQVCLGDWVPSARRTCAPYTFDSQMKARMLAFSCSLCSENEVGGQVHFGDAFFYAAAVAVLSRKLIWSSIRLWASGRNRNLRCSTL